MLKESEISFNKKRSIMEKLNEFKNIHRNEGCVVLGHKHDACHEPKIWASSDDVRMVLRKLLLAAKLGRKTRNQERHLKKMIEETKEVLKNTREEYMKKEIANFPEDMEKMLEMVDMYTKEIEREMMEADKDDEDIHDQATVVDHHGAAKYKGKKRVVVEGGEGLKLLMEAVNAIEIKDMFN